MVNSLINASRVYVNTLHSLGAIHPREMYGLAILMFLDSYREKFITNRTQLEEFNDIIDCMKRQGCLAKRVTTYNCVNL